MVWLLQIYIRNFFLAFMIIYCKKSDHEMKRREIEMIMISDAEQSMKKYTVPPRNPQIKMMMMMKVDTRKKKYLFKVLQEKINFFLSGNKTIVFSTFTIKKH